MFTSMDKALAALVMAILSIITLWTGWGLDLSVVADDRLASAFAILSPIAVYFIPNRARGILKR
jgi:hypothetical protein